MTNNQTIVVKCCLCGKVSTDRVTWQPSRDSKVAPGMVISHGYCPECYKQVCSEMLQSA